jgi:adenosylmethionine-8-amino-7-oxononanoate aminotransferase
MLLAENADERPVLSLVLQRAGLAVTTAHDLERVMKTWLERPADLVALALGGDHLMIAPPYTVTEDQVGGIVGTLRQAIQSIQQTPL